MNPAILAGIVVIGVILAIIAIIVILKASKPKTKTSTKSKESKKEFEFDELMKIVQNPNSSSLELLEVLKLFNKYLRIEQNEHDYLIFLSKCLNHQNVNKDIFQYFHKEIKNNNSTYKTELETIEMKALG